MSAAFDRLVAIMARLRDPERGCPWDVEQDFRSIAPHTIEEAYEVADAIEHGDMGALRDELGDLLLQVVFHARMAEETGHFDTDAVVEAICDKLVRRHPHVFGDARVADAAEQTKAWEALKDQERLAKAGGSGGGKEAGVLDGVAVGLPALTRAVKLTRRAGRVGFDWDRPDDVLEKFTEEVQELKAEIAAGAPAERLEDELGDLLFNCANLARKLDLDPEAALRRTNAKFERRFGRIEKWLAEQGRRPQDATLAEMEALWVRAKSEERA